MRYGKELKKICFKETDKKHADLKIRLNYDGISQKQFFSEIVSAYLEKDVNIMNFIFELKERKKIQTIAKRRKVKQMYNKSREVERKFNLSSDELESIFDLIEEEI